MKKQLYFFERYDDFVLGFLWVYIGSRESEIRDYGERHASGTLWYKNQKNAPKSLSRYSRRRKNWIILLIFHWLS